jgi:antitoxin StbD
VKKVAEQIRQRHTHDGLIDAPWFDWTWAWHGDSGQWSLQNKKTRIKTYSGVISMQNILADVAVSVSELMKNPSSALSSTNGLPVAVLNHNRVVGYMVPANVYEAMVERLDEVELVHLVKARLDANETPVRVSLDDLIGEAEADIANSR